MSLTTPNFAHSMDRDLCPGVTCRYNTLGVRSAAPVTVSLTHPPEGISYQQSRAHRKGRPRRRLGKEASIVLGKGTKGVVAPLASGGVSGNS